MSADVAVKEATLPVLGAWQQTSQLFPLAFNKLNLKSKITVLEVGPASSSTVEFFSQYKCRLHFADLFDSKILKNPSEWKTKAQLVSAFRQAFDFPKGTQLDLCLFWDLFNYLDANQITAFCEAIKPYISSNTRGHGFGLRNNAATLSNYQYGIKSADTFLVSSRQTRQTTLFPLPQAKLKEQLSCFIIDRGLLLKDGRQEMLLSTNI